MITIAPKNKTEPKIIRPIIPEVAIELELRIINRIIKTR